MPVQERQQRERKARIQLILRSALAVFSAHGYHGTRMDLIAEEAELGKATLYYYFKSKDELLCALLEQGLQDFFHQLEQSWQKEKSPVEKIKKVAEFGAQFFQKNPDFFRLYGYLMTHPSLHKKVMPRLKSVISEKLAGIRQVFIDAQQQELIRHYPIDELLHIFGSLVMGMGFFPPHHAGTKSDLQEKAQLINDIFLNGVLQTEEKR